MGPRRKKHKLPGLFNFLSGYSLGFLAWVAGLHCLEVSVQGNLILSGRKLRKHLFKLFLWTTEVILLYHVLGWYRGWILQATTFEIEMAFLVKSVVFLYVKVFWPRVFPEILPGLHVFLCPQCFQRQTFRFQPVSFRLGFFVTYLCRYCSCLVDGWGKQIFFPVSWVPGQMAPAVLKLLGPVALTLLAAIFASLRILEAL